MRNKMMFILTLMAALTGCSNQEGVSKGVPWWVWLLILVVVVLVIILFIRVFWKKGKTTIPVMTRTVQEPEPHPGIPDNLTLIEGIGPKTQSVLIAAGINNFKDLAALAPEAIKDILTQAGLRLGVTDTWPEQARLAAEGKLDELKELQDKLTGGREA
jgi:hypothetical protein